MHLRTEPITHLLTMLTNPVAGPALLHSAGQGGGQGAAGWEAARPAPVAGENRLLGEALNLKLSIF